MTTDASKPVKSTEELTAEYNEIRDEVTDWIKYVDGLKFSRMEDMVEFCYAWTVNHYDNPKDTLAAIKYATVTKKFFPYFLRLAQEQIMVQEQFMAALKAKNIDFDNMSEEEITEAVKESLDSVGKVGAKTSQPSSFANTFLSSKKASKLN